MPTLSGQRIGAQVQCKQKHPAAQSACTSTPCRDIRIKTWSKLNEKRSKFLKTQVWGATERMFREQTVEDSRATTGK